MLRGISETLSTVPSRREVRTAACRGNEIASARRSPGRCPAPGDDSSVVSSTWKPGSDRACPASHPCARGPALIFRRHPAGGDDRATASVVLSPHRRSSAVDDAPAERAGQVDRLAVRTIASVSANVSALESPGSRRHQERQLNSPDLAPRTRGMSSGLPRRGAPARRACARSVAGRITRPLRDEEQDRARRATRANPCPPRDVGAETNRGCEVAPDRVRIHEVTVPSRQTARRADHRRDLRAVLARERQLQLPPTTSNISSVIRPSS